MGQIDVYVVLPREQVSGQGSGVQMSQDVCFTLRMPAAVTSSFSACSLTSLLLPLASAVNN